MSQTRWCVFFLTYAFSFFTFPSILFSPLPLQSLVIANKSTDSAPAATVVMKDNVCMCACVRVYKSATDVVGCAEIFGGQRGLTQSIHGASQRRKLCVCTHMWTLIGR